MATRTRTATGVASQNAFEQCINSPTAPYLAVITAWVITWWLQMNTFSFLNVVPGVELPFFPAGIRTLAVFIFGIHGAIAILIGSLISYEWLFPAVAMGHYVGVVAIASASSFSAYVAMKLYLMISKTPTDLSELNVRKITVIVLIQSVLSATLHQIIYRVQHVSDTYEQLQAFDTITVWGAMVAGDLVGSMIVMLVACMMIDMYQALRHRMH